MMKGSYQEFQRLDFFKREVFEERGDDYFSGPVLMEIEGIEREVDFSIFLNGRCDEFAVALVRKYGGRLVIVTHHDEDGQFLNLAHAYAVKEDAEKLVEIDIRGKIQSDSDLMMMEYFEDFYFGDNLYDQDYDLEEGISVLCELLEVSNETYTEERLTEASQLLDWLEVKYQY